MVRAYQGTRRALLSVITRRPVSMAACAMLGASKLRARRGVFRQPLYESLGPASRGYSPWS
jgi:hypothetical protein